MKSEFDLEAASNSSLSSSSGYAGDVFSIHTSISNDNPLGGNHEVREKQRSNRMSLQRTESQKRLDKFLQLSIEKNGDRRSNKRQDSQSLGCSTSELTSSTKRTRSRSKLGRSSSRRLLTRNNSCRDSISVDPISPGDDDGKQSVPQTGTSRTRLTRGDSRCLVTRSKSSGSRKPEIAPQTGSENTAGIPLRNVSGLVSEDPVSPSNDVSKSAIPQRGISRNASTRGDSRRVLNRSKSSDSTKSAIVPQTECESKSESKCCASIPVDPLSPGDDESKRSVSQRGISRNTLTRGDSRRTVTRNKSSGSLKRENVFQRDCENETGMGLIVTSDVAVDPVSPADDERKQRSNPMSLQRTESQKRLDKFLQQSIEKNGDRRSNKRQDSQSLGCSLSEMTSSTKRTRSRSKLGRSSSRRLLTRNNSCRDSISVDPISPGDDDGKSIVPQTGTNRATLTRGDNRRVDTRSKSSGSRKSEIAPQTDSENTAGIPLNNVSGLITEDPVSPSSDVSKSAVPQRGISRNASTRGDSRRGLNRSKSSDSIKLEIVPQTDCESKSVTPLSNSTVSADRRNALQKNESLRRINTRRENVPRLNLRRAGSVANLSSNTHKLLEDETIDHSLVVTSQLVQSMNESKRKVSKAEGCNTKVICTFDLEIGERPPSPGFKQRERMVTVDNVLQWKQELDLQFQMNTVENAIRKEHSIRHLNECTSNYLTKFNQKVQSETNVNSYDWVAIKSNHKQVHKVIRTSRAG
jgi:hypothetical protein